MTADQGSSRDQLSAGLHTPGPWSVGSYGDVCHGGNRWDGVRFVFGTDPDAIDRLDPEVRANTQLISAAPDMLAVLQAMFCDGPVGIAFAGNPVACDRLEAQARAAIAKATGQ